MGKLSDLSLKRNWKQAIVFYLAYLLLSFLVGALAGAIAGIINPDNVIELASKAGTIVGSIYCLVLYFSVYIKKKMSSFPFILMGAVAFLVSLFLGTILSLIFVAILTTRDSQSKGNNYINNSEVSEKI